MKSFLPLLLGLTASVAMTAQTTEVVNIQGTDYDLVKLQERQIGPGAVYTRYRVPAFPLNINLVKVDVTNPYIKIETSMANDRAAGTELLVNAAKRYDAPNHHAITAQNSNFWIVSTQPQWNAYNASTHNINMRNGMLGIDSKSFPHWWWWDTQRSGIVSCTADNELFIDACRTEMTFRSEKLGTREFTNCNKGFKTGQTSIYTPWFGPDRQFLPLVDDTPEQIQNNDIHYDIDENSDCIEVMLRIADGETWMGGRDIKFIVAETRATKGRGVLGDYDLAIVSRDADLATLAAGDEVFLNYSWVFNRNGQDVRPLIEQAVGGNMLVMQNGQITEQNYWDSYNTMVYSRSAYGVSEDNKTLFMMTIDKSSDPVYGVSNGCTTADMCDIMRFLGAWNVVNVDAGGSAELMVDGKIINKTTEGVPRAVGNGWMVFNTAPDDDTEVAALAFYDVTLRAPAGALYSPRVIAFNKYGTQLDDDYRGFTVLSDDFTGTGCGTDLQCGANPGTGVLTVEGPGGITASKDIELFSASPVLSRSSVVIDDSHDYIIGVTAQDGDKTYTFDPSLIEWTVKDPAVATVDTKGCLHAVANGTTEVAGNLNGSDVTLTVNVENCPTPTLALHDEWTSWTVKGNTGLKDAVIAADGTVTYNYGSPRGTATLSLTKATTVYGLPTSVVLEFTSDIPLTSAELDLMAYNTSRNSITVAPAEGFAANTPAKVVFDVAELGDVTDASIYPLTFKTLKLSGKASSQYKGDRTLRITGFYACYDSDQSVTDITVDNLGVSVSPNPVEASSAVTVAASSAISSVDIYSLSGALISHSDVDSGCSWYGTAPAVAGTYIVRVQTGATAATAKLIVL